MVFSFSFSEDAPPPRQPNARNRASTSSASRRDGLEPSRYLDDARDERLQKQAKEVEKKQIKAKSKMSKAEKAKLKKEKAKAFGGGSGKAKKNKNAGRWN